MSILRNFKSNIRITSNLHYCDFTILSHQLSQLLQIGQTVKTNVFVTGELIRGTFLMAGIGSGQFGLLNISTSPVNTWVRHARFGMNYTASYMPLLDGRRMFDQFHDALLSHIYQALSGISEENKWTLFGSNLVNTPSDTRMSTSLTLNATELDAL